MSQTELQRFTEACNYPGKLDESAVEQHLRAYLGALGAERQVVQLRQDWRLEDHPSLKRNIGLILQDFEKRSPAALAALAARAARAASDALAARDASDALAARAARDALAARAARAASDARDASDALAARAARAASDALAARDARAASDALAARDARAASDALAARDARSSLDRFAAWCVQWGSWWGWGWDLSWIVCTWFGAKQNKKPRVEAWSKPLLEAFISGCWFIYWTDDTLFWVAKPNLYRDENRRLHNGKYAAVESNAENLYFWHGVLVPAFVVVRPDWITTKHIDEENNAEVRRVMIERYRHGEEIQGAGAYMRDVKGKRLDHDERFGTLWHREIPNDEPIVMLECINSTPEADRSFKHYWLRVPPQMKTAHEAVAWTFGKTPDQYAPMFET
jgi:hypothetical protein